jgi:hypothetical protein
VVEAAAADFVEAKTPHAGASERATMEYAARTVQPEYTGRDMSFARNWRGRRRVCTWAETYEREK